MINLNHNRSYSTPAFLRLGFRPFFFVAAIAAILSMLIWALLYHLPMTVHNISASYWHAHEMIFAYAMAVIVGFLLTATKNWTGQQTLYGKPLLFLFVLWIAGRFLIFIPEQYLIYQALIDVGFLALSTVAILHPIIKTKQWQHLAVVGKVIFMTIAHIIFYLGLLGIVNSGERIGIYLGFYLVLSLIFMMTRKLIPFFIERGIKDKTTLKNSQVIDTLSLVLFIFYALAEVFLQNSVVSLPLAFILLAIHLIRMHFWYHPQIWGKPLLWSLYCAYGFLTLGFAFKVLSYFVQVLPSLDIHSFALGIGMITISMMSRVTLGHTGNDVFNPPKLLSWVFVSVIFSFIFRVLMPIFDMQNYAQWILLAQFFWIMAFILFLITYTPLLFKPRVDGGFG